MGGSKALKILMMVGKNLILRPSLDYLHLTVGISFRHSITVFDSLYVALAITEGKPLLTLDGRQRKAVKETRVEAFPK